MPFLVMVSLTLAGCGSATDGVQIQKSRSSHVLRLAVTTSTRDTGLLELLVPKFERKYNARVDVIAVGTGNALKLGEIGEVDVVLVHARAAEDEFMNSNHGIRREDVMYNRFELLGPPTDPAGIRAMPPVEALRKIAASGSWFVSRGDASGTYKREQQLWSAVGSRPEWDQYVESGQGMGPSLLIADQRQAYILADRGTYLAMRTKVDLVPLAAQTDELKNPYGIMVVNPVGKTGINESLAQQLVDFFVAPATQKMIRDFQVDGGSLFYPVHPTASD
jgi:tungstate transport system substrate-binding protein